MKIIKFERKYLNEVSELFYNTIHNVNIFDYSEVQLNVWAPRISNQNDLNDKLLNSYSLLLLHNDKVVAYGNINDEGLIDHFYVHHLYQRLGCGGILLNSLEEYFIDKPFYSTFASKTSVPFFEKNGYIIQYENIVDIKGVQLVNFYMRKDV